MDYHKINSIFKRNMDDKYKSFLMGQYTEPCFEYLANNPWDFTEKVDGTNIHIDLDIEPDTDPKLSLNGRTENAQIPQPLVTWYNDTVVPMKAELFHIFPYGVRLWGEGYGGKIQGGSKYRPEQGFVLFDIMVGVTWLSRKDVEGIGKLLGLDVVPLIGCGTLADGIARCQKGFNSQWGDFEAEGIVARPITELKDARGNRIITKIKCRDFKNGK